MGQNTSTNSAITSREHLYVGQLLAWYERDNGSISLEYSGILGFIQWLLCTNLLDEHDSTIFHMPLDFDEGPAHTKLDTFTHHLYEHRNKFCAALVTWMPYSDDGVGHASLLLAGMFTHGSGIFVRWRMYDPNYPFDDTIPCDPEYARGYAAQLDAVQAGLQRTVGWYGIKLGGGGRAQIARITCNSRGGVGGHTGVTQEDMERSCLLMRHSKGICVLICLTVLTQLLDNSITINDSMRAFENYSVIDNYVCKYMHHLSESCVLSFKNSNCYRALVTYAYEDAG